MKQYLNNLEVENILRSSEKSFLYHSVCRSQCNVQWLCQQDGIHGFSFNKKNLTEFYFENKSDNDQQQLLIIKALICQFYVEVYSVFIFDLINHRMKLYQLNWMATWLQ